MKKQIIILALLSFNLNLMGQHYLGLKGSGALSRVYTSDEFNSDISEENNSPTPSFEAGGFYNYVMNKSLIGVELLFVQAEGKYNYTFYADESYYGERTLKFHLSYLSLPIYYGMQFNKITTTIGVKTSLFLQGNLEHYGSYTYYEHNNSFDYSEQETSIDKIDFGPQIGVLYALTDNLSIEAHLYHSLTKFTKYVQWYNQQATLGVRYSFSNNSKK